jgi:hypothetical protein
LRTLNELQPFLSETIEAWKGFNSPDGDIRYFSDEHYMDNSRGHTLQALPAVKKAFEKMEKLHRRLQLLESSLTKDADAVSWNFLTSNLLIEEGPISSPPRKQ